MKLVFQQNCLHYCHSRLFLNLGKISTQSIWPAQWARKVVFIFHPWLLHWWGSALLSRQQPRGQFTARLPFSCLLVSTSRCWLPTNCQKQETRQGEVGASAHGLPAVCFPWQLLLFRLFPPPLQYLLVMEVQPAELQLSLHCLGRLIFLRQPQRCKSDGHKEGRKPCCWRLF